MPFYQSISEILSENRQDMAGISTRTAKVVEALDGLGRELDATVFLDPEFSHNQATSVAKGNADLPLFGVPLAHKELYGRHTETAIWPDEGGSRSCKGQLAKKTATTIDKLDRAGAIDCGRLVSVEYALGVTGHNAYAGTPKNPWNRDYVCGGSSSGSAAVVAAGIVPGALGSDTGGSIRQPAAFCGVVGMKPTYGRCSRWGIVAFASSLDQAGPFTRDVADSALMFASMAGHDARDSTSADATLPDLQAVLQASVKGMKIGIPKEYVMDGMDEAITALWQQGQEWLVEAGAELVPISLPHTRYALPTYYIIAPAEASSNLARYDGVRYGARVEAGQSLDDMYEATRAAGFGDEVQRRIMIGTYALSAGYYDAYYLKAQQVRRLIKNDFDEAFEKVDAILTPATPSAAFPLGVKQDDPITMYLNDVFTVPANLAGIPGISVPAGFSQTGLPLGLQVLSGAFREDTLYKVAACLEKQAGFTGQPPRHALAAG